MDHKVEKGLNDQLYDFVELFRVHPSYYWVLALWLTTYSMQDSFSMARSTGSYVLPPGGDLSAAFLCAMICVNIHEENPSFFWNASNFIINGGIFTCQVIPDTNHRGMRVCRSLRVLCDCGNDLPLGCIQPPPGFVKLDWLSGLSWYDMQKGGPTR